VHGWVVLDKPVGMTSTHAVAVVKRLFQAKRAGHAGTLDPLASGGLPIALGEATKTVPFVMDGRKRYRFTVRWGEERDTDDAEGRVVGPASSGPPPRRSGRCCRASPALIEQVPPQYSAIKIQGERAYDLARDGETVELQPGRSRFTELTLVEHARIATIRVRGRVRQGNLCPGAGPRYRPDSRLFRPYQRAAADRWSARSASGHDSAGTTGGFVHRAASGEGSLADALLPVETALDDIPALAVTRADAARLQRGQAVLLRGRDAPNS
jgi:tRNA pseudouridine55 synthase